MALLIDYYVSLNSPWTHLGAGSVILRGTAVHLGSAGVLALSDDPSHVIATVGLQDVIVVRTKDATLVVRADMAEKVKDIAALVPEALR